MKNEQEKRIKTQLTVLFYMIVLVIMGLVFFIWWDILRQQAGYESLVPGVGAARTARRGAAVLVLVPALPVIGLFLSLKSPQAKWHLKKGPRILLVHALPLFIGLGMVAVFTSQYQQLQGEIVRQQEEAERLQESLKLQQELQERQREEERKMISELSQQLEEAAEEDSSETETAEESTP